MGLSTDKNGMPLHESFAFGLYECAKCGGNCYGHRVARVLKGPFWADFKETEVLIPAGRQSFHPTCWQEIKQAVHVAKEKP